MIRHYIPCALLGYDIWAQVVAMVVYSRHRNVLYAISVQLIIIICNRYILIQSYKLTVISVLSWLSAGLSRRGWGRGLAHVVRLLVPGVWCLTVVSSRRIPAGFVGLIISLIISVGSYTIGNTVETSFVDTQGM